MRLISMWIIISYVCWDAYGFGWRRALLVKPLLLLLVPHAPIFEVENDGNNNNRNICTAYIWHGHSNYCHAAFVQDVPLSQQINYVVENENSRNIRTAMTLRFYTMNLKTTTTVTIQLLGIGRYNVMMMCTPAVHALCGIQPFHILL